MPAGRDQPVGILPDGVQVRGCGSGRGPARCDSADRFGVPQYGRPRITQELRRRGWQVNAKRVYRILREDNLLCLRKRKFVVTTDSSHRLAIYPNLAREQVLNGIDQLWVADLTYVRLELEFVYLAVVLDAFSRRVIGWALDRTLEATLTLSALGMALKQRQPKPGLTHHSDRGVQYASTDYTGLLGQHGIRISMSRTGNPYDNAKAESFIKTLKYEEVYRQEYRDLAEARVSIGHPGKNLQPEAASLGAGIPTARGV